MDFISDISAFQPPEEGSAVTFGFFDGVHMGHRALIQHLCERAHQLGTPAVIALFDRHPATIVRPDAVPRLLTDRTQKLELLRSTGVDVTCLITFDEERSLQTPEQFVDEILVQQLQARVVVAGADHHFGHRRRGGVALLRELGRSRGFALDLVPYFELPDFGTVSSTLVRDVVMRGEVRTATALLGRHFEMHGVVEHGDARGRTLGFPTANVALPADMVLPADGIYAGWYRRPSGKRNAAAVSIGRRPTFYKESGLLLVEAHLLDFDDDLYGEWAWVEVSERIRGQVRFERVEELVEQMRLDVERTRALTR